MQTKTSLSHPLRVDFIDGLPTKGRLGLTFAPGKKGPNSYGGVWERDLNTDLQTLHDQLGTNVLVSLLEPHEFDALGVPDLLAHAEQVGLRTIHFPIRDVDVPKASAERDYSDFVATILAELGLGRTVVIHCRGGLGRSGLVAASTLTQLGFEADHAMAQVRQARPGAVETRAQEAYIRDFAAKHTGLAFRWRYRGALLGLAAGDALGTTVEFSPPGTFDPVTTMVGGGPFGLTPGQWTDDTSMALCLAESLIKQSGFDAHDQMERYVRWWREGHWSSTGRCFDIGVTTRTALERFVASGDPFSGSTDSHAAGNGSLMRLAPVPLAFAGQPEKALEYAAMSSRTTHGAPACVDACGYFAGLIVGALHGHPKGELLAPRFSPVPGYWESHPLHARIDEVAAGSFMRREPPEIKGGGWVVRSMEAALYAFATTSTFEEGALRAVNLGDDADTTGAIYGQIAGAYYGVDAIPRSWRELIALRQDIQALADGLLERAQQHG